MFNHFYKKYSILFPIKHNFNTFFRFSSEKSIYNYQKFYFCKPDGLTQPVKTGPPPKTKEQLKIERCLEQWPEFIRNAPKNDLYLTSVKTNLEKIYKFHQGDRNYIKSEDLPHDIFQEVSGAVCATFTTETISGLFQEYEGFLTDHWIMTKLLQIALTHKDLTDEFFTVILPQAKETLKRADKASPTILFLAGFAGAALNLGDKEFWEILEYKMIKERLYRYLSIDQMVKLAHALAFADKGSDSLFKLFEVNFIKHRKLLALKPKLKLSVQTTYYLKLRGSSLLFEALENPNIEISGIDPKIPLMDKSQAVLSHKENDSKLISDTHH